MNKKQRLRNRQTAKDLHRTVRGIAASKHICEECGQPGFHWHSTGDSLEDIMNNREPNGFWSCDKFYGPDGRRININDNPLSAPLDIIGNSPFLQQFIKSAIDAGLTNEQINSFF